MVKIVAWRRRGGYDEGVGTALVLSAGGMYAAWEAGVWKALAGRVEVSLVIGASGGAWNGWLIAASASPEEVIAEWLDPRTAEYLRPGLHWTGVVDPAAMHAKARELAARYRPRMPFALTMVEVPRLRTRLIEGKDVTWQHLAATATIPACFPPVRIDGRWYVDGGLMGALPLWAAEKLGAARAIGVKCITHPLFRTLHAVLPSRKPNASFPVTMIQPSRQLGSLRDSVRWSRPTIESWIALGEEDGKRAVTSITM